VLSKIVTDCATALSNCAAVMASCADIATRICSGQDTAVRSPHDRERAYLNLLLCNIIRLHISALSKKTTSTTLKGALVSGVARGPYQITDNHFTPLIKHIISVVCLHTLRSWMSSRCLWLNRTGGTGGGLFDGSEPSSAFADATVAGFGGDDVVEGLV
jgi:hypothetical protein